MISPVVAGVSIAGLLFFGLAVYCIAILDRPKRKIAQIIEASDIFYATVKEGKREWQKISSLIGKLIPLDEEFTDPEE